MFALKTGRQSQDNAKDIFQDETTKKTSDILNDVYLLNDKWNNDIFQYIRAPFIKRKKKMNKIKHH